MRTKSNIWQNSMQRPEYKEGGHSLLAFLTELDCHICSELVCNGSPISLAELPPESLLCSSHYSISWTTFPSTSLPTSYYPIFVLFPALQPVSWVVALTVFCLLLLYFSS